MVVGQLPDMLALLWGFSVLYKHTSTCSQKEMEIKPTLGFMVNCFTSCISMRMRVVLRIACTTITGSYIYMHLHLGKT